jgi:hypothetical protein
VSEQGPNHIPRMTQSADPKRLESALRFNRGIRFGPCSDMMGLRPGHLGDHDADVYALHAQITSDGVLGGSHPDC